MSDTKTRSLDRMGISNLGDKIMQDCQSGTFPNGKISATAATTHYGVALNVLKDGLLNAFGKGLTGAELVEDQVKTSGLNSATINNKGTLTIPRKRMVQLSQSLPEHLRYSPGLSFNETVDAEGNITLRPNR